MTMTDARGLPVQEPGSTRPAEAAKEGAGEVLSESKAQAKALASDAWSQAQQVAHRATGEVRSQADQQAARLAGNMRTLSDQLRAMKEGRADEAGPLGGWVDRAVDQLQSWAGRLDREGVRGLGDDVARFARRRPGLFLASAAGLGFVAGRALRAARAVQSEDSDDAYRVGAPGYYGSGTALPSVNEWGPSSTPPASFGTLPGQTPVVVEEEIVVVEPLAPPLAPPTPGAGEIR